MKSAWLFKLLTLGLFLVMPLSFGGCEVECDTNETAIEEAADEIEDAAEEAGETLEGEEGG